MSELNDFEVLDTQEMNNNLQKSKELEETTSHQPCFLERLANDICRNYNWIIVLMLTPISLSYDFYCFGKYLGCILMNRNSYTDVLFYDVNLIHIFIAWILVSFWFINTFLTTKINHEDGVKNIQKQILEWRKTGMKQQMCSARPSWKSISLQNLTYKDKLYKVKLFKSFKGDSWDTTSIQINLLKQLFQIFV